MSDGELEFPEIKPMWKGQLIPYEAVEKLEQELAVTMRRLETEEKISNSYLEDIAELREEHEKYRLGMQENCQLRRELAELREAAMDVVETFDGSVLTTVAIIKLAALLKQEGKQFR